jgi:intron-binding protein aquarius
LIYIIHCLADIERVFKLLEDCRAMELLRTPVDRANYLITNQARIIAMTCTHAALKVLQRNYFLLHIC